MCGTPRRLLPRPPLRRIPPHPRIPKGVIRHRSHYSRSRSSLRSPFIWSHYRQSRRFALSDLGGGGCRDGNLYRPGRRIGRMDSGSRRVVSLHRLDGPRRAEPMVALSAMAPPSFNRALSTRWTRRVGCRTLARSVCSRSRRQTAQRCGTILGRHYRASMDALGFCGYSEVASSHSNNYPHRHATRSLDRHHYRTTIRLSVAPGHAHDPVNASPVAILGINQQRDGC